MKDRLLPLLLLAWGLPMALNGAQQRPHWLIGLLDADAQTASNPVLHIVDPRGELVQTVSLPGSGTARALAFDEISHAWVCRGDAVHELDETGAPTGIVLSPPSGSDKAQDVTLVGNEVWVGWGVSASASVLASYDAATGVLLATATSADLEHPRRVVARADGTALYLTSRALQTILRYDLAAGTFSTVIDLSGSNFGPVGLAFDERDQSLWVASSWGQAQVLGKIEDPEGTPTYTQALAYGSLSDLLAPSGLAHDRYDRLYVASRARNGGTPGLYIHEAGPATSLTRLQVFPTDGTALGSLIDVALRPAEVETVTPLDPATQDPVLTLGQVNPLTFRAPDGAGQLYAAGVSLLWPACPLAAPAADPYLRLPPPDVRGLAICGDSILAATAGQVVHGADAASLFIGVTGFAGFLDAATGEAPATIDLTLLADPGLAGNELSLAWLTFDATGLPALLGPQTTLRLIP